MISLFQKKNRCSAVIVAAGSARRMGGIDKVLAELDGKPVLWHTVRAFELHPDIAEIVVVTREDLLNTVADLCQNAGFSKVKMVLSGGDDRLSSVQNGVSAVDKKATHIAVHDGARPLVSADVIAAAVRKAEKFGAAAPAIAVKDTVKVAQQGTVTSTPDRSTLFAVQTPQVFDADLLRAALVNAAEKNLPVTDDCSCVEAMGMRVFLTEGEERNLKITTPIDLKVAELFLKEDAQ